MKGPEPQRHGAEGDRLYPAIAILLHWSIALAILGNIALGVWMGGALASPATAHRAFIAFQLHKSLGLTVLALSGLRLLWRLVNPPPPLPSDIPGWERAAAHLTHWALYGIMILIPLSGWLYVSSGWSVPLGRPFLVPTLFFGLFQVPHLFGLPRASLAVRALVAGNALLAHVALAWAFGGLFLLHVGAALKHQFVDRDAVLASMVPGLRAPGAQGCPTSSNRGRRAVLAAGFAALAGATIALVAPLLAPTPPPAAPAPIAPAPVADRPTPASARPASTAVAPTPASRPSGPPPAWTVEKSRSALHFSGAESGAAFLGTFADWTAAIRFDPDNLDQSAVIVTVRTASASDGNPVHDSAMSQAEWFDSATYPTAIFRSRGFRRIGADRFRANGTLTLKGKALPIALPFILNIAGDEASVSGTAAIDRVKADMGMTSDPGGATVSKTIAVTFAVRAKRS